MRATEISSNNHENNKKLTKKVKKLNAKTLKDLNENIQFSINKLANLGNFVNGLSSLVQSTKESKLFSACHKHDSLKKRDKAVGDIVGSLNDGGQTHKKTFVKSYRGSSKSPCINNELKTVRISSQQGRVNNVDSVRSNRISEKKIREVFGQLGKFTKKIA